MKLSLLCLFILTSFAAQSAVLQKLIIVIHSYPMGEWQKGITKGLEENLKSAKIKYKFTHILYDYETLKFKDKQIQDQRIQEITDQIKSVSPDYIVINDDEAIEKLLPKLSASKNIILNGINDLPENTNWGKAIDLSSRCGVIEYYPVTQSLKMISQMSPSIKSMSILSSQGDSSRIVANIFKKLNKKQLHNINLRKVSLENSWENWKKELLEMNGKDGVGWILVPYEVVDSKGRMMPLNEMAEWIRSNISIPLLGILSIHTKMGFLSAISVEPYGLGKQSAEIVTRIENGEKCPNIGFEKSKYHNFEINLDELKRFKFKVPDSFLGVAKFIKTDKELSK